MLLLLAFFLLLLFAAMRRRRSSLPYPPTPPGHFLLGNLKSVQTKKLRSTYSTLARRYGHVFHLSALGQHIVVLNSSEAAEELFSRRSHIYSDRTENPMLNLMGWGRTAAVFLPYGETWRAHRRLLQQGFSASAIRSSCHHIQSEKIHRFLYNLLNHPDDFMHYTELLLGAVILKYVYGRDIDESDGEDVLFAAAAKSARAAGDAVLPGVWLVNSFPSLQLLPEWFPGCYFYSFAREIKDLVGQIIDGGYEEALRCIENESFVKTLEDMRARNSTINGRIAREVCGTAYAAAAETSRTTLATFFLLMREHPEVQHRAHRELSEVIGANKLPSFGDRAALPYVQAVYLEVMRWMPALTLSIPHTTSEDDVYMGYFIPKGTMVIGNTWAMLNDENKYPDPRAFRPERFLTPEGKLLTRDTDINSILAYGFGRRICPGRHFADAFVWHVMANVLAGFNIGSIKADDTERIERLEDVFSEGLVSHTSPFKCNIAPRTLEIADLIRNEIL